MVHRPQRVFTDRPTRLLGLTSQAMVQNPDLPDFWGVVADSGEGRWTSIAAIETSTPTPVLATELYSRFTSRGEAKLGNRVLPPMRWGLARHVELKKGGA